MADGDHKGGRFGANGRKNGHGQPDQLSLRMDQVRKDLRRDVALLSEDARLVSDWRRFVRRHPFATAGAAALVGYSLVPAKKQVLQASREDVEALARAGKLRLVADGQNSQQPGLLSTTLMAVGVAATRLAAAYVSRRIGEKL